MIAYTSAFAKGTISDGTRIYSLSRCMDNANRNFHNTNINQIFLRRNRAAAFIRQYFNNFGESAPERSLRRYLRTGAGYAFDA